MQRAVCQAHLQNQTHAQEEQEAAEGENERVVAFTAQLKTRNCEVEVLKEQRRVWAETGQKFKDFFYFLVLFCWIVGRGRRRRRKRGAGETTYATADFRIGLFMHSLNTYPLCGAQLRSHFWANALRLRSAQGRVLKKRNEIHTFQLQYKRSLASRNSFYLLEIGIGGNGN